MTYGQVSEDSNKSYSGSSSSSASPLNWPADHRHPGAELPCCCRVHDLVISIAVLQKRNMV